MPQPRYVLGVVMLTSLEAGCPSHQPASARAPLTSKAPAPVAPSAPAATTNAPAHPAFKLSALAVSTGPGPDPILPDGPYVEALRKASDAWGQCLRGAAEVSFSVVLDPAGTTQTVERMGDAAASACMEALIIKAKLPPAPSPVNLLVVVAR